MPFMLPSMKRLAVSSHLFFPLVPFHLRASAEGAASASRGSVILLFALIKGKRLSSPAHEGSRRVGAPSSRRHSTCGQGNIRAHPPVEPARDRGTHRGVQ